MKVRKFVSAFSALTIAASAFAGMAITASAATTVSYDFEDGIAAASDISRMADCTVVDSTLGNNATKVQKIGGNKGGQALAGLETPIDMTADNIVQVEFDYTMDARHTDLSLRGTQPTTSNARDYGTTGRFLRIGSNNGTSGIVFVDASGATVVAEPGEWVHVKTVIDFGSGKMDNDVYTYSAKETSTQKMM